jgi:hypothetical protein
LLTAVVGAILFSLFGLSNRADALTFSAPAGVLNAAAEVDATTQPQQVWWRRGWGGGGWGGGWRGGGWGPRPYYYGYYRPWPSYYSYYPYGYYYPYWGWGWRRWWW